jgi:hypothetical protein
MADRQQQFTERLKAFQPTPWDLIPDLGLYMDQVITFVERQCKELFMDGDRIFTPSMLNNYVKIGLVDRPVAKKYAREQLAQLLMLCVLKQSISSENMKTLMQPPEGIPMRAHYEGFCQTEQAVFSALGDTQPLPLMACAVQGAAYQLLCNTLLHSAKPAKGKLEPAAKETKAEAAKPAKKK